MTSLTNVSPQLRRAWHPVGRVESFGESPTRVELLGEAYVVARLDDTVKAFLDVCPHRNGRLSDGLITHDCLRCPYHGWEFDSDGACAHVPALGPDATLPPARLTAPLTQERFGLLWIAPEEPVTDILHIPEWDDELLTKVWMPPVDIDAAAAQAIDNFLDFSHFPYVHAGTFGTDKDRLVKEYSTERTGDALCDALIDSARSVIGQVGLLSTTVSRTGRRAKLTTGTVYTRYASKDDLLIDAMRVLLDEAITDNRPVTDRTVDRVEMGNIAAHLLTRHGGEKRRPWLWFRLEADIAASHRRDLAAVLDELYDGGRQRYHVMLAPADVTPAVANLVAIVGRAIPLGLAVLEAYIDDLDSIDFRHVTMPLLGSVADAAGAP